MIYNNYQSYRRLLTTSQVPVQAVGHMHQTSQSDAHSHRHDIHMHGDDDSDIDDDDMEIIVDDLKGDICDDTLMTLKEKHKGDGLFEEEQFADSTDDVEKAVISPGN